MLTHIPYMSKDFFYVFFYYNILFCLKSDLQLAAILSFIFNFFAKLCDARFLIQVVVNVVGYIYQVFYSPRCLSFVTRYMCSYTLYDFLRFSHVYMYYFAILTFHNKFSNIKIKKFKKRIYLMGLI